MTPSLQIAIDTISMEDFFLKANYAFIGKADILEIGTPSIIANGLNIVSQLRKLYPTTSIYADLKSIDFTKIEVREAFDRGANYVSVMLNADNDNVVNALKYAKKYKGNIVFSTMGYPVNCLLDRIRIINKLGGNNFIAHGSGITLKKAFHELTNKLNILKNIPDINVFAGGGINLSNIQELLKKQKIHTVIVGRGAFTSTKIQHKIEALKSITSNFKY